MADMTYSPTGFCRTFGLTYSTLWRRQRSGQDAPRMTPAGRRVVISENDALAFIERNPQLAPAFCGRLVGEYRQARERGERGPIQPE